MEAVWSGTHRCTPWIALGLAAASCGALGCGSGRRVILEVELRSDYVAIQELSRTRTTLRDETQVHELGPESQLSRGITIARYSTKPGLATVEIQLQSPSGVVFQGLRRELSLSESQRVVFTLTRSCAGVECSGGCLGGRCVPSSCTSGEEDSCPTPDCATDDDCGSSEAECMEASCRGGVCLRSPNDQRCVEGSRCDPRSGCSSPPPGPENRDGGPVVGTEDDASVDSDAGPPDAPADAGPDECGIGADEETVAYFSFDEDTLPEVLDVDGRYAGVAGEGIVAGAGAFGDCGASLLFPTDRDAHVTIPDSDDWDLAEGAIELWIRAAAFPDREQDILSRDAAGTERPGHLTLGIASQRHIYVRLQQSDQDTYLCSDGDIELDRWTHLGLNFGPEGARLYVNGTPAMGDCGSAGHTIGIAGNDNPILLGADSGGSNEGESNDPRDFFRGGAIDDLRISRVQRDFASYFAD